MDKAVINKLPISLCGKRVFLRIDLEGLSEAKQIFIDDIKLCKSLPTIKYLVDAGARVIIGTHIGTSTDRPSEALRLGPIAVRLSQLLNKPVRKLDAVVGVEILSTIANMQNGDVVMLENLFYHSGEISNDAEFARELAQLADIYCNDAFALADRALASTIGIVRYLRPAVAGLAMEHEILMCETILERAKPPLTAIIAGARVEEKLYLLEKLLPKLDRLFIGGALAFPFLKVKGEKVGAAPIDKELLPLIEKFLRQAEKQVEIILPQDFIVVNAEEYYGLRRSSIPVARRVLSTEILSSDLPLDVGAWTINQLEELIESAGTVIWNGPLGVCEIEQFSTATRTIASFLIENAETSHHRTVICGDSLTRVIRKFSLPVEQISYITAGGNSLLGLLAGHVLSAVAALDGKEIERMSPLKFPCHVLLPVDGSPYSLKAAQQLHLLTQDTEITLLYVWKPPFPISDQSWIGSETRKRLEFEERLVAEQIFDSVNSELARYGLTSQRQLMLEGDPAEQILKYADDFGADLIVMGSHGKTSILRFLMGSVSRKVLDCAHCPVLVARIPDAEMAEAGMIMAD
ncbi:MAG: phosphoglycerate kinase [Acidobacteriota bacterium]